MKTLLGVRMRYGRPMARSMPTRDATTASPADATGTQPLGTPNAPCACSLDPAPSASTRGSSGNQVLAASLPPGRYVFEADDQGLRIFSVDGEPPAKPDAATIRRAIRDGSCVTSMQDIVRMNTRFHANAEAMADAAATGQSTSDGRARDGSLRPAAPSKGRPTLVQIQARNDEFWRARGG